MIYHDDPNEKSRETIHYTAKEFLECRHELRDILIVPFDESKCKGTGYNISPSELCYSVRKKHLLQIHRTEQEIYILIPPHDTVLTLSHEYLQVSAEIAGCFLSRLRPVTQGLGNISTTLDPCWKGMLLLAINNPSSKKVKLTLSQKKDDVMKPVAISTMLLWKTLSLTDSDEGVLTFRLDNPAMRADIWSELIAEPYRLFRTRSYQQFQELIHSLICYQPDEDCPVWVIQLQKELDRLQIAVQSEPRGNNTIRETMLAIHHLECERMPPELISKLHKLYLFGVDGRSIDPSSDFYIVIEGTVKRLSDPNAEKCKKDTEEFLKIIHLLYKECNYQKLCCQVDAIHQIITEKTQYHWRLDGFKRAYNTVILPNISAFLATIFIAIIVFLGKDFDMENLFSNFIICIIPSVLSIAFNYKKHKNHE